MAESEATVFVWDFKDLTAIIPENHEHKNELEQALDDALTKILVNGFRLDSNFEQSNIMDIKRAVALQDLTTKMKLQGKSFVGCGAEQQSTSTSTSVSSMHSSILPSAKLCADIRDCYEEKKNFPAFSNFLNRCGIKHKDLFEFIGNIETMGANSGLYRNCLSLVYRSECVNVVISYSHIKCTVAGMLGRLMLGRFAEYVRAENVFCIQPNMMIYFIKRIQDQFRKKILLITSNAETKIFADENGFHVWKVNSDSDLVDLSTQFAKKYPKKYFEQVHNSPSKFRQCPVCQAFIFHSNLARHIETHVDMD